VAGTMKRVIGAVREFLDIRTGEHVRLWSMFAYLLFVLFAYYIVKPVSRAMFLTRFDIDKLPLLYILIAVFGGVFAYFYSRLASKTSLSKAVSWAMGLSVLILIAMWWLIRMRISWMVYAFNIWVSLFSVILVSQGWLVAGNLFDAREAKRLYPILGMGMVVGAAFGGEFTNRTVALIGSENLLLASAVMVGLAYLAFLAASSRSTSSVASARAAREEETDFSFGQMFSDLARVRHLQIIVGMMIVMYLVDTLVEYQFQAMARTAYRGDQLTAFFGQFYGLWLNGVELIFQLFLTGLVVRWFGVGATLQIAPVAIAVSSLAILGLPGVAASSAVRLTEASTRYTLSKTGMELLYMPLPLALRNRIKAFIDICVDRLSRGIGGVLLLLLTTSSLHLGVRGIAAVVIALSVVWIVYSHRAKREYVASIRKRLADRRLDLSSTRLAVTDAATVQFLEEAAQGTTPRQAVYALSLLAEAPKYDMRPLLLRQARGALPEVRAKMYEIAANLRYDGLLEIAAADSGARPIPSAVAYLLALSPERARIAQTMLASGDPETVEAALEGLRGQSELAAESVAFSAIERWAQSEDSRWRAIAARAIGFRGDHGTELLHRLLADYDSQVAAAALDSASVLKAHAYLYRMIEALGSPRLRAPAIRALASFGSTIAGTLADVLLDEDTPLRIRRMVPRVLRNVQSQRAVDALLPAIGHPDLGIRTAVLKALNRLRETSPGLHFDDALVMAQLMKEARRYYELHEALAAFRETQSGTRSALSLLTRTLEARLRKTLERLFRLLGLRYPPKEIYSAYRAVSKPALYDASAALEFLDNILDRDLKRVLLPLLDAPEFALDRGREIFGVRQLTLEEAIGLQIQSGDSWLAVCAMGAAAELRIHSLAPEIASLGRNASLAVSQVAQSVGAALA
jgi:ATP:ADP antiporter, AAA family